MLQVGPMTLDFTSFAGSLGERSFTIVVRFSVLFCFYFRASELIVYMLRGSEGYYMD